MALFAIQLVRIVLSVLIDQGVLSSLNSLYFVMLTHQMFNVIKRSVHFNFFCFSDKIYLARALHQQ